MCIVGLASAFFIHSLIFVSTIAWKMIDSQTIDELMEASRLFDHNKTGYISSSDLRHTVSLFSDRFLDDDIDEMFAHIDVSGDGLVDYARFVRTIIDVTENQIPGYVRINPSVYTLQEAAFEPTFANCARGSSPWSSVVTRLDRNLFSFPFLTRSFCQSLHDEMRQLDSFCFERGLDGPYRASRQRYKSSREVLVLENRRLESLGFFGFCEDVAKALKPLCASLFPWMLKGSRDLLRRHHCFGVRYDARSDAGVADGEVACEIPLLAHEDDSLLTINVCLSDACEGGELLFGDTLCNAHAATVVEHAMRAGPAIRAHIGTAVIHLGCHQHCTRPLQSGQQHNLLIWLRAVGNGSEYGEEGRTTLARVPVTRTWCSHCAEVACLVVACLTLQWPQSVLSRHRTTRAPLPKLVALTILRLAFDGVA